MSCVTVKVPWAPAPLACMRRSGMTSRWKWASFSISQMSWRSAGPRRPAVWMFRLSLTGAPVAWVRYGGLSVIGRSLDGALLRRADRPSSAVLWGDGSAAPGGAADHAAEVAAMEVRLLVGNHVGLDVAEGRLRLVLDAVVARLDNVFIETLGARMGVHHGLALGFAVCGIGQAEHVHFHAGRYERHDGVHVLRNAGGGVKRDRGPDGVDVSLGNPVAAEKVAGRIGAVDLEALGGAVVLMREPHIMEHRACVEKLRVEA